ncbi:response regulator [Paenibacillus solisilvae]|uniref:Response regulator n=1 Tax=Paenibacillus solisilvae TaxID=2486751 RepID=A0ABW0VT87_9BACL
MYKVLITDDEPTIREGLRTLIDWEHYGYQVVDTAANGKDALIKYDLYKPDLMIVDIRMPGMSGLELIEKLRQDYHEPHVLILSGYADFDYAKKAIKLNIDGYLLKPVDEDELIDYLLRLQAQLNRESEAKRRALEMEEKSREAVIQSILTRGSVETAESNVQEAVTAGLQWERYAVILMKLYGRGHEIEPSQLTQIKKGLVQAFDEAGRGIVFSKEPYLGLLLNDNLQTERVRNSIHQDIHTLAAEQGMSIAIAAGQAVRQLQDISSSYEEAYRLLAHRFFYEDDQIITVHSVRVGPPVHDEVNRIQNLNHETEPYAYADKIYLAIDVGNMQAAAELVSEMGQQQLEAIGSEQEIKGHFAQVANRVLNKKLQSEPELQSKSQQLSADILAIYQQTTYSGLEQYFVQYLHAFNHAQSHGGTDKQINKMIDLIQRNYYENLKLDALADVFNYNSAYLGKLFKTVTGEYFNTYLDKVRIEKAKELLSQGMKVYQVAEKVGYTNVDYFHSKFRKYVGGSPSAYRKKGVSQ